MDNSKAIIKGLIAMRCMSSQALADGLGMTVPAVRNKLSRNSWAINDLVKLAHFLGYIIQNKIINIILLMIDSFYLSIFFCCWILANKDY